MRKLFLTSILCVCILTFGGCAETNTEEETTTTVSDEETYGSLGDFWNDIVGDDDDKDKKNAEDEEEVMYDKNGIVIKFNGYEYHSIMGYLEMKLCIENNSDKDLTFSLNGSTVVNGYSLDSYLHEDIRQGTKKNVSLDISKLKENGIKEKDISDVSFRLDVYNTNDWSDEENGIELNFSFN